MQSKLFLAIVLLAAQVFGADTIIRTYSSDDFAGSGMTWDKFGKAQLEDLVEIYGDEFIDKRRGILTEIFAEQNFLFQTNKSKIVILKSEKEDKLAGSLMFLNESHAIIGLNSNEPAGYQKMIYHFLNHFPGKKSIEIVLIKESPLLKPLSSLVDSGKSQKTALPEVLVTRKPYEGATCFSIPLENIASIMTSIPAMIEEAKSIANNQ
jgi:hypothetical protein